MRTLLIVALLVSWVSASGQPSVVPRDIGYAVGYDLGSESLGRLQRDGLVVDKDQLIRGFSDALLEREARIDAAARRQMLARAANDVATRRAEQRAAEDPVFAAYASANLERSHAFHRAYADVPGVQTLDGGAQYRVMNPGSGTRMPQDAERVVVSYTVRLIDGSTVASETRREMTTALLTPGVATALRAMPVGATWEVAAPPEQALGMGGDPPFIGPNETLIVTVELHGAP